MINSYFHRQMLAIEQWYLNKAGWAIANARISMDLDRIDLGFNFLAFAERCLIQARRVHVHLE